MGTFDELQNKVNGCDSENSQGVDVSPFGRYKSNTESMLTLFHLVLLNAEISFNENTVDPDQMPSDLDPHFPL